MISRVLLAGVLAMVSAEEQFPFSNPYSSYGWGGSSPSGVDSMSSNRPTRVQPIQALASAVASAVGAEKESICEPDEIFFSKDVKQALIETKQTPEFDGSNTKIALNRGIKYMQIDQPFSHAANALSLAETTVLDPDEVEEAKADELRRKIREKHQWSGARIAEENNARQMQLVKEAQALKANPTVKIDAYYVNMDNQKERKNCLEHQFKDMPGSPIPTRYPAVWFPDRCIKAKTNEAYEECLKEAELGDCFEAGIDYAATGTHGTQAHSEHKIRNAVISNWCGHKRLFKQLEQSQNKSDSPDYVVVLEDDVVLDRKYFMKVLKDFTTNYPNRDWDMVQLDPFGHKDRKDFVEHWRGKPVFKPTADSQCSQYWGFHAVLIKVSALHRINHWMSINRAVPIDWLPWRMPHVLAYSALISRNPEATLSGGAVVLPQYCSAKVMKSTIG